jgi:hypothetical protein
MAFSTDHPPYASTKINALSVIYHKPYPSADVRSHRSAESKFTFVDQGANLILTVRFREETREIVGIDSTNYLGEKKNLDNPEKVAVNYLMKLPPSNKPSEAMSQ